MTFSATSPGSGFHGELILCWAGVGLVGRSVEVGAWRVWVKKVDGGKKGRRENERTTGLKEGVWRRTIRQGTRMIREVQSSRGDLPGEEVGLTRAESGRSKGGELGELPMEVEVRTKSGREVPRGKIHCGKQVTRDGQDGK
jgi:hypothetical protein